MDLDRAIASIVRSLERVDLDAARRYVAENRAREPALDPSEDPADIERVFSATHEAAHALIAIQFGLRVLRAVLRKDGSGFVAVETIPKSPESMLAAAMVDLAGPCFELLLSFRQEQYQEDGIHDFLLARVNIEEYRSLSAGENLSFTTFARMACCAVQSNLPAIERLATALLEAGELDGDRIAAFCCGTASEP